LNKLRPNSFSRNLTLPGIMDKPRIRTLLIDIGQVLVALDLPAVLGSIAPHTSLPVPEVERRLVKNPDILLYETGLISTQEIYERVTKLLETPVSFEHFRDMWVTLFRIESDTGGALLSARFFRELKQRYQLVALSNTNEMHFEYLTRSLPLVNEFDDYVLSYRVQAMKPDRRIYQAALEITGCTPEELLFVDDLPENVAAAREMGIRSILFVGEEQLREDLEKMGLIGADDHMFL
jgi:glucose-1-phosphatase